MRNLALLLSFVLALFAHDASAEESPPQLRVLTYNIHGGVGTDGVLDLDRVADVIAGTGAEVVALQEVDRHRREQSAFADQPGLLAQRLGMHLAYAACLDDEPAHPGAPRAQYGTALLSVHPLVEPTTTLLPCWPGSEQRGLLDDTLLLWGGEFGRTPVAQGTDGRDHNPEGFTMWLAGAGMKTGIRYGATDDFGYFAAENKMHVHDLHATLLHLLGLDHERLTYRYASRNFRLTDVAGDVHTGVLV